VDALDERVLGDDEPAGKPGGVVLDPLHETLPLELRQQAELPELREPHRSLDGSRGKRTGSAAIWLSTGGVGEKVGKNSSVLGEFFAARSDEIDETLVGSGPSERFTTVQGKGLTEVSLSTLGEIMQVGTYDGLVERIAEGPQTENGEAGVLALPAEFRDALASSEDVGSMAEQWTATDELVADGWQTEDATAVLRELAKLARAARAADRDLWYWWSL